jgi:hypothetical protein
MSIFLGRCLFYYFIYSLKSSVMPDPYAGIRDFFSALSLPTYRKYISSAIQAAGSLHYWKKEDPGSLLYFQKKLKDLIDAARTLVREGRGKREEQVVLQPEVLEQEIIDPALYIGKSSGLTQWEAFPRSLSKKEFLDPYLVFERFFRYKKPRQWQKELKAVFFYTLSPYSCLEELPDMDLLQISSHLHKLVEAAHLIRVREPESFSTEGK